MMARVYMNHGRWIVDCPHEECAWSYMAMTDDGRPRYLHSCHGDQTGKGCDMRIDLAWPPLDAALEIELILFARRARANRNWRWPETVDGLSRENEQLLVGWNLERLAEAGIGVV